ncbi:cytochrome b/b6 domain-containing protein [Rhodovulum tesquicola]|uniref:cytochrome b/b6 domain-containing protein n=1 Tax=Rhodovulum tesquicola TaxID=540254 RepID=UPI002097AE62|nr:cytochrome b/b6 domain-containing protein [Rhodovulum tesquicola]MCO8144507.1 cytochrome b/b6 domain-containing protein [Rhodovulum tesquicola]
MKDTGTHGAGPGGETARADNATVEIETIRVWDPLLRLFHWLLAIAVVGAWGLGKFGPNVMTLHFWFGYAVLGLLAFRLIWGFVGPEHARFGNFLYGPVSIGNYVIHMVRREPSYWRGHNPLGGFFVFVLLGVLAVHAGLGLIADPEDYVNAGPLAREVSTATSRTALAWHATLGWVVLGLVVLHVAAIGFYRKWKGEDLIRPMITGRKTVRKDR